MESLAFFAVMTLLIIFATSFLAFGLSWIRNRVAQILTIVFAALGVLSAIWLAITLTPGNGIYIAIIPGVFSAFAVFNTLLRARKKS